MKLHEILRKNMPQLKGKDTNDALKILSQNGIAYRKGNIAVNALKPTQQDGIPSKIDAIANAMVKGEPMSPIWVSVDGSIIDGHHRWLATRKINGNDARISAIMIMLPKLNALELFDKVSDMV